MAGQRPAIAPAQQSGRVAVIDIGSNSLRLVVFDGLGRALNVLFNEKVLCGLGRGMGIDGRLNAEGVKLALVNLRRFVMLARAIKVTRLDVLATAAVRDAEDGPRFVAEIEGSFDVKVRILSGEEEGKLSALGVLAGIPDANGIMGDLGGGSIELVPLSSQGAGVATTLPLGPLRLQELGGSEEHARETIDRRVADVSWLKERRCTNFYPVGGAWRALARIHMEQTHYPLHVIQQYSLSRAEAEAFLDILARQSRKSLEKVFTISRKRLEVVPTAAYLLWRLIRTIQPERLVFSAYGLREGHVYSLLDDQQRRDDPLIAGCIAMAAASRRFGAEGQEVFAWTSPIFEGESGSRSRLRLAAAILSDLAWAEHPDYRADQAFRRCLYMPVAGMTHEERSFLATTLHARYGGGEGEVRETIQRLLDEEAVAAARARGLAMRLAYTLSGGVPGVLSLTHLSIHEGKLTLALPREGAVYFGESVQRRLDALGRMLNLATAVRDLSSAEGIRLARKR